jgi:hypothetical protein
MKPNERCGTTHQRHSRSPRLEPWGVVTELLFVSSSASPYNLDGTNRTALVGLIGWLGWAAWIIIYSITLLRL